MDDFKLPSFLTETADDIHKRMLLNAPIGISTIEGDLFWDSTRATAEEIEKFKKIALVNLLKSRFAQTAVGEDLNYCSNGLERKKADYAIQKIKFIGEKGIQILKDKIICTEATEENESIEFLTLDTVIIGENGEVTVNAKCTIPGEKGNVGLGKINILATQINRIKEVSNIEIVKYGVDIEDDESYRNRILDKGKKPSTSGNKYDYEFWAKEVVGVGEAKCFPTWNGPGTVKVVVIDSNRKSASNELILKVKEHIESVRPIIPGTLTVASAVEKTVDVVVNISTVKGYNLGLIKEEFTNLLDKYLKSIAFNVAYISIAKIGNILLSTEGVLDYMDLKVNNLTSNIALNNDEIAVLGTINLGVM